MYNIMTDVKGRLVRDTLVELLTLATYLDHSSQCYLFSIGIWFRGEENRTLGRDIQTHKSFFFNFR